jgi:hypothetical protein
MAGDDPDSLTVTSRLSGWPIGGAGTCGAEAGGPGTGGPGTGVLDTGGPVPLGGSVPASARAGPELTSKALNTHAPAAASAAAWSLRAHDIIQRGFIPAKTQNRRIALLLEIMEEGGPAFSGIKMSAYYISCQVISTFKNLQHKVRGSVAAHHASASPPRSATIPCMEQVRRRP